MKYKLIIIALALCLLAFSSCTPKAERDKLAENSTKDTTETNERITEADTTGPVYNIDARLVLTNALGTKLEGKILLEKGEERINGEPCQTFSMGTGTEDDLNVLTVFAVTPDGTIYALEDLSGKNWYIYPLDK